MKNPKRLYVAGPMRGIAAYNFPAFDEAAGELLLRGHEVFSPAQRDRAKGFDPIARGLDGNEDLADEGFDLRDALNADLKWITKRANAVILLPGWTKSSGAGAEVMAARAIGIPAYEWDEIRLCSSVCEWSSHCVDWTKQILGLAFDEPDLVEVPDVAPSNVTNSPPVPELERTDVGQETFRASVGDTLRRGAQSYAAGPGRVRALPPIVDYGIVGEDEQVELDEEREGLVQAFREAVATGVTVPLMDTETHEIRVTSETGGAKGKKPLEVGAVDPLARAELGRVAYFGGQKYSRGNYLNGYPWSSSIDALHRHMLLLEAGHDRDDESGLLHAAHVAWHGLALTSFMLRQIGTDDRFEPPAVES